MRVNPNGTCTIALPNGNRMELLNSRMQLTRPAIGDKVQMPYITPPSPPQILVISGDKQGSTGKLLQLDNQLFIVQVCDASTADGIHRCSSTRRRTS